MSGGSSSNWPPTPSFSRTCTTLCSSPHGIWESRQRSCLTSSRSKASMRWTCSARRSSRPELCRPSSRSRRRSGGSSSWPSEAETTRLVEQAVRLGQHRFASAVLENYQHSCAFCGFAPRSIRNNRLLVASHIKPWAVSTDRERLDPLNGVAACPTHDAAFDTGLITVNGGLRVHRAPRLAASTAGDPGVDRYFGEALGPTLFVPEGGSRPDPTYLTWHHQHMYQGELASC